MICASLAPGEGAEAVERFFEPEHYATLSSEGPQFAETPDRRQMAYIHSLVETVTAHRTETDEIIRRHAHGWRPERLSRTAGAILRSAICEILYIPDVPAGAAINEAVELAKKYGDEEAPRFINGVLGGFVRGMDAAPEAPAEPEDAPEPDGRPEE